MVTYSRVGRWKGRLTRRPLPERDPEIDRLTDAQRCELGALWLQRAASERRVADAFQVIRSALEQDDRNPVLVTLAARAGDDEHRHAELARLVASRFAGRELDPPARLQLVVPEHRGATPQLRRTLHVLGHCAVNETFASAFLEVALKLARHGLARAALQEMLSDEIDHARIGWGHLAGLPEAERRQVDPWLFDMLSANLKMWRDAERRYAVDAALFGHGSPPRVVVERALLGALRKLIIPGLSRFGMQTEGLHEWLAQGAPT
jgi:hypothetical protein